MSVLIKGITLEQFYRDLNNVRDMDVGWDAVQLPPHGRLIDADVPIQLVDIHGKTLEVTVAHIIENNLGIVNAIIESEEEDDKNI